MDMKRRLLALMVLLLPGAVAVAANTSARLALAMDQVRPGETITAGIVLEMAEGWHTYWRNPGDSGMATEVDWTLPSGVTAGPIQWPTPEYYDADGLVTYVHHGQAVLLVPLTFSEELPPGSLSITAEVSWLECEIQCVPGDATVEAEVTIATQNRPSADAGLLARAESRLPEDGSGLGARAAWEGPASGDERALIIQWPVTNTVEQPRFFPYASGDYSVRPQMEQLPVDSGRVALRAVVERFAEDWPTELAGVIFFTEEGVSKAFEVQATIESGDSVSTAAPSVDGEPVAARGLVFYLLLGLGGGLILNLMPCVLPILSLKVLSLIRQGGSTAGERRWHGVIYTLGVLVSFWVISGLVIAGSLASWGAQFQDPRFIVVVTVLMTLVALNLFGVFEVVLPGSAVTGANQLASKEGLGGAFFNGVLAVILGASCVAPLLAAAIGWAVAQPPLVILLVFTLIGFGLALPFLLLSFFPALQALLPKPGPWMEKFKVVMGFPMLATAAWLLSQTADHFGVGGPLWVGLFLVVLALALWIYGEFIQRGTRRKGLAWGVVLVLGLAGYGYTLEAELDWRHPPDIVTDPVAGTGRENPGGISWQPWSPEAVEAAREQGKPVLVDFTANWCLTCKLNKKTSLEIDAVRDKLEEIDAVALKGDYTRKNPDITAELKRFGRAGVPLVLVYPGDASRPPSVLPTLLTPDIVLNALEAAAE